MITEPDLISTTELTTNVSCNGGSDGTVTLNASGGTGTLIEDWGTADPTQYHSSRLRKYFLQKWFYEN